MMTQNAQLQGNVKILINFSVDIKSELEPFTFVLKLSHMILGFEAASLRHWRHKLLKKCIGVISLWSTLSLCHPSIK